MTHSAMMYVVIEPSEAIDEQPDAFVVGVEDVRAVMMDLDAGELLGVAIAGNMRAFVDHQHTSVCFGRSPREDRPEHPATDH